MPRCETAIATHMSTTLGLPNYTGCNPQIAAANYVCNTLSSTKHAGCNSKSVRIDEAVLVDCIQVIYTLPSVSATAQSADLRILSRFEDGESP